MKVICLERVDNLGAVGSIVEVKDGYARNFLIPSGKVLPATKANVLKFENIRQSAQNSDNKKLEQANKVRQIIDGCFINVVRQAGDDGRLYGSVTSRDVASILNEKFNESLVNRYQISFKQPIKQIGIYTEIVKLHSDIKATINIVIARNESEADESREKFLSPDNKELSLEEQAMLAIEELEKRTKSKVKEENTDEVQENKESNSELIEEQE